MLEDPQENFNVAEKPENAEVKIMKALMSEFILISSTQNMTTVKMMIIIFGRWLKV